MAVPRVPYDIARDTIKDGDVLLCESMGWVSRAIRWATRSRYSHAALAAWWGDRLLVLESRERHGCRCIPMSSLLSACRVTVYRCSTVDAHLVIDAAVERLGGAYGWRQISVDAIGRLPVLALLNALGVLRRIPVVGGWLSRLPWGRAYSEDDLEDPGARVKCSTLVALAYRAAGIDLVPNLADRSTDPGDLARSAALAPVVEIIA